MFLLQVRRLLLMLLLLLMMIMVVVMLLLLLLLMLHGGGLWIVPTVFDQPLLFFLPWEVMPLLLLLKGHL